MSDLLKSISKQPYWVIVLIIGAALIAFPCVDFKGDHLVARPPITYWPVGIGIVLLSFSLITFILSERAKLVPSGVRDIDLKRVTEEPEGFSTKVGSCEILVKFGRIETHPHTNDSVTVLPCNEYFDDHCIDDPKGALGAYVSNVFEGQSSALASLMKDECRKLFGEGSPQRKTEFETSRSFGSGRALLLINPLGKQRSIALVSTSTQRAGEGINARISYLFQGMGELFGRLADAKLSEVAMPILGSGRGGLSAPLALVGLLLAVAEAARYGHGGTRPRKVTVIVFQKDSDSVAEVDPYTIRRALALIGDEVGV